jgi:Xaa-Pro aminopeptidase
VVETAAKRLEPGITEREVARRVRKAFHQEGVHTYFHVPVVLFGDRTAYPGEFGQLEALSTDRVLRPGDAVILDAAPIYDGFMVDTSYAFTLAPDERFDRLDRRLKELRDLILDLTRQRLSMRQISRAVNEQIRAFGVENCHRKHIAAVLGHRVTRVSTGWMRDTRLWGLAPREVGWFFATTALARAGLSSLTPNWNHTRSCECPPQPGLWAIEPHLGYEGVGVKFEEILVVTDTNAYWLDEDLPHQRRWEQKR